MILPDEQPADPVITDEKDEYGSEAERAEIDPKYDGVLSSYRERHISIAGFCNGFKTIRPCKLIPCPIKWVDESQYFVGFQVIGWCVKLLLVLIAVKMLSLTV